MATGKGKRAKKLSSIFDHYTKEQVDEMQTDRKEMWDRFFAKGGEMETIPPHITRDMLERWKF
jgi:hypothetical protein